MCFRKRESEKDSSVLDFESFIFSRGSQILTATVQQTHTQPAQLPYSINLLEVIVCWSVSAAAFAE